MTSLERFLDELDFDIPAGLVERARAAALTDITVEPTSAARFTITIEAVPRAAATKSQSRFIREPAPHRAMVLIAAVLVVVVVVTLVFTAHALHSSRVEPADKSAAPTNGRVLPVGNESFYSARDAAAQVVVQDPTRSQAESLDLEITHDGGQSWIKTGISAPDVGVFWLDSQHLFVAWDDIGYPSGLQFTSDGGYHWRAVNTSGPGPTTYFLNASEGWTASCRECGQGSLSALTTVFRSTDSGAHWQPIGNPISWPGVWPIGLYFVDSVHGFMGSNSGDAVGRLVVTQDGGATWRLVDLPAPPGGWVTQPGGAPTGCGSGACTLLPVMFGKQGVLLVEEPNARPWFTYVTTDGGLTWGNPRLLPVQVPQPIAIPWQAPLDPNNWWMADPQGILYSTRDAGLTWQQTHPKMPAGYMLAYVKPVGGNVLWGTAVTSPGQAPHIVKSNDGGTTWSLITSLRR